MVNYIFINMIKLVYSMNGYVVEYVDIAERHYQHKLNHHWNTYKIEVIK